MAQSQAHALAAHSQAQPLQAHPMQQQQQQHPHMQQQQMLLQQQQYMHQPQHAMQHPMQHMAPGAAPYHAQQAMGPPSMYGAWSMPPNAVSQGMVMHGHQMPAHMAGGGMTWAPMPPGSVAQPQLQAMHPGGEMVWDSRMYMDMHAAPTGSAAMYTHQGVMLPPHSSAPMTMGYSGMPAPAAAFHHQHHHVPAPAPAAPAAPWGPGAAPVAPMPQPPGAMRVDRSGSGSTMADNDGGARRVLHKWTSQEKQSFLRNFAVRGIVGQVVV